MENYKSLYFNEESPKYVQIADYIKNLIDSKIIRDGDKLPTICLLYTSDAADEVQLV